MRRPDRNARRDPCSTLTYGPGGTRRPVGWQTMSSLSKLSIIMPVLDEGESIAATLDALAKLRARGTEVIVVDGGSRDATIQRARLRADHVITAPRGRAAADERRRREGLGRRAAVPACRYPAPADADHVVLKGLERSGRAWGRFDVKIDGRSPLLLVVGWLMNLRSRLTGIATGDQAIFVRRDAFHEAGGFADDSADGGHRTVQAPQAHEPAAVPARARHHLRPALGQNGVFSTILLMWRLRLAYLLRRRSESARAAIRLCNEPVGVAILAKAPLAGLRQDAAHAGARRRRRGLAASAIASARAVATACAAAIGPVTLWATPDETHPAVSRPCARIRHRARLPGRRRSRRAHAGGDCGDERTGARHRHRLPCPHVRPSADGGGHPARRHRCRGHAGGRRRLCAASACGRPNRRCSPTCAGARPT